MKVGNQKTYFSPSNIKMQIRQITNMFFLGMVNNYQRNAGSEDDRDSASLSLLTPLDVGDQVPSSLIRQNKNMDLDNLATICILSLRTM
jgi:hypothetical protein